MEEIVQPTNQPQVIVSEPATPPQIHSSSKKRLLIILTIIGIVVLASIGVYFVVYSMGSNKKTKSQQVFPSVIPTEKIAPTETNMQNVTPAILPTTQVSQEPESANSIMIDFINCTPDRKRIDVDFGSTTYEIKGKSGDTCQMDYGGEVENPNGNESLTYTCNIPSAQGIKTFNKAAYGVDFSSLDSYCSKK